MLLQQEKITNFVEHTHTFDRIANLLELLLLVFNTKSEGIILNKMFQKE